MGGLWITADGGGREGTTNAVLGMMMAWLEEIPWKPWANHRPCVGIAGSGRVPPQSGGRGDRSRFSLGAPTLAVVPRPSCQRRSCRPQHVSPCFTFPPHAERAAPPALSRAWQRHQPKSDPSRPFGGGTSPSPTRSPPEGP